MRQRQNGPVMLETMVIVSIQGNIRDLNALCVLARGIHYKHAKTLVKK